MKNNWVSNIKFLPLLFLSPLFYLASSLLSEAEIEDQPVAPQPNPIRAEPVLPEVSQELVPLR